MVQNKIVANFKNQTVLKGKTNDFFPNKDKFHMEQMDGTVREINVEDLKALFFVKDYKGNRNRKDNYKDDIKNVGRKTEVKFSDGEIVSGYTLGYSPDRQGFYLTPADLAGNNERIFIVKSATENIQFV